MRSFRYKIGAAINVLLGRPTMYRITLKHPLVINGKENTGLKITETYHYGKKWYPWMLYFM